MNAVNWTVNRGAPHGSLQAARPDIRRIVALSQESRANEATFRDLESNIRRALQRAGEVPTTEKPVKLGGMLDR